MAWTWFAASFPMRSAGRLTMCLRPRGSSAAWNFPLNGSPTSTCIMVNRKGPNLRLATGLHKTPVSVLALLVP